MLILHSVAEFSDLIIRMIDTVDPDVLVEIGAEEGLFTREIAERVPGRFYSIDPAPRPSMRHLAETVPSVELLAETSLVALGHLEPADFYVIDGDHNYYTVRNELEVIARVCADRFWTAVLHDVGWPWARRDQYYDPDSIPEEARHPFSYERGVVLGTADSVEGGLFTGGEAGIALHEGGPKNGVLTAVEDFLDGRQHARFARVPAVFGLGIIYDERAPYADALANLLACYDGNPLLDALEQNRLQLIMRTLEQDRVRAALPPEVEDAHLRIRDLVMENRALWARIGELEQQMQEPSKRELRYEAEIRELLDSRILAMVDRLARLRQPGRPVEVWSDRLRAVLDSDPL